MSIETSSTQGSDLTRGKRIAHYLDRLFTGSKPAYIDFDDPRDYGGMTFDLSCEPDVEMLLAMPEEDERQIPPQHPDNGWSGLWD